MLMMLSFSIVLSLILVCVYQFVCYIGSSYSSAKLTPFECGFEPLSNMRSPFSTRFFILVVLFLIFDIEIALLFPVMSLLMTSNYPIMAWGVMGFLFVLCVGLFHEWIEGSIDWISVY